MNGFADCKPLDLGGLKIKLPIIQGGMGVGISLSSLAGAAAKEGAAGIISTAQIGFRDPDFEKDPLQANLRAIPKHVKRAREIAGGGVIGVNIMVATKEYARYVAEAVKSGVDLIISGAGLPMELPKLTKGSRTKLLPIVSSLKAAELILKTWKRRYDRLPDGIVVEGPKAGGHLGFKKEALKDAQGLHYEEEIKSIISYVRQFGQQFGQYIPVITAGGIRCREDVEKQRSLGADGVQVATRFVPTEECDASMAYKEAYIECRKEDIVIVNSPVGMPGRAIRNAFIRRTETEKEPIRKCFGCLSGCRPDTAPYCITKALINAAKGDIDNALLFCGAEAYKETRIRTVKEVLAELL